MARRVRARSTWLAGRRERRERERGARAVRSRRVPRATPTRLIQLELEEDVPRHGLSLLLTPCVPSWALVRFDGACMRLEVITASTCAQRPHHARSGDREGTRSGQLSLWRAGTLFGRGSCRPWRAQVERSGRLGRGAWWWWQRACTWRPASHSSGSTDLNWALIATERVCRTFVRSVFY